MLVVKGDRVALLGRKTAEELGVFRVGIAAEVYFAKFREINHQAFTGFSKLKNYQMKLNIDENVTSVVQPITKVPFSRNEKVVQNLKEIGNVDVIETVEGPTQCVNPLMTVKKPNGDVSVYLDTR